MSGNNYETYCLVFIRQTEKAIFCTYKGYEPTPDSPEMIFPKSKIKIWEVDEEEYDTLVKGEELDIEIPDWLAEDKDLI